MSEEAPTWQAAVSSEDMAKLVLHLLKPETIKAEGHGRCLFFQAIAATAFTLWLRFDEVLTLKGKHMKYRLIDGNSSPIMAVVAVLPFRNSNPLDPSQANVYNIYPQPDQHICLMRKFINWHRWLVERTNQEVDDDGFVFPDINRDDQVDLNNPFSIKELLTVMDKFAADAGLMDQHKNVRFDEHSFRRGGARHYLLYAQDKWSLKAILWWGGWTEKDPVDQIVEYLLGHPRPESGFSDMLSPHESRARGLACSTRDPADVFMDMEMFKSTIVSLESKYATSLSKIKKESRETGSRHKAALAKVKEKMKSIEHRNEVVVAEIEDECREAESRYKVTLDKIKEMEYRNEVVLTKVEKENQDLYSRHKAVLVKIEELEHRNTVVLTKTEKENQESESRHKAALDKIEELEHRNTVVLTKIKKENQESESRHKAALAKIEDESREMESRYKTVLAKIEDENRETESRHKTVLDKIEKESREMKSTHKAALAKIEGMEHIYAVVVSKIEKESRDITLQYQQIQLQDMEMKREILEMKKKSAELSQNLKQVNKELRQENSDLRQENELRVKALHQEVFQVGDALTRDLDKSLQEMALRDPEDAFQPQVEHQAESETHGQQFSESEYCTDQQPSDRDDLVEDEGPSTQQPESNAGESTKIPRIVHWKDAIRQWYHGDPENGLAIPLNKWSAVMRANRSFWKRRMIVKEFEYFGRDEGLLEAYHGENVRGVEELLQSISQRREQEKHCYDDMNLTMPGRQQVKEQEEFEEQLQQEDGEELDEEGGSDDHMEQFIPRIDHWKRAISQWDRGDPSKGLTLPLRLWPARLRHMHKDTFYPRQTIVNEFEHFGRNEAKMRKVYGDSMDGPFKKLLTAIRKRHRHMKKRGKGNMDTDDDDESENDNDVVSESKNDDDDESGSENDDDDESGSENDDDDESGSENDDDDESGSENDDDDESGSENDDNDESESEEEERLVRKRKRVSHVGKRAAPKKTKTVPTRVQPPRHVK